MFFRKKEEEAFKQIQEKLKSLEAGIAAGNKQFDGMNENISRLQTMVQKHDMAMEDLLEEWEERRSDEEEVRERFRVQKQNEDHLLALFEGYQEQFWNLKRFADSKDEVWSEQIALMEQNLDRCRRLCEINVIGVCGEIVDYDLHEVIQIMETDDSDKNGQIAEVYSCGYLYKGKVKKKARVAAYRKLSQEQ